MIKLVQWFTLCLVALGMTLWLGSCFSPLNQAINLNFGGAGMVRTALQEIEELYQQEHPYVVIHSVFAGSAVIRTAIERGEPFDGVFFADLAPLDKLQTEGLIVPESRKDLLTTDVVIIAPVNSTLQLSDFRDLASDRIKSVAIGNDNLGIGRYTATLLENLGIAQAIASKAVVVTVDVREVLLAVEQGEADVGITFLPEARASDKVKVLATAPREAYEVIQAGMAAVQSSAHVQDIQAYLDFISGDRALAIFEEFGLFPLSSQDKPR